ncbi:hypothetical protein [Kineococcus sp. NUM-3379]
MREVELVLEQGGRAWPLGTADAEGAEDASRTTWPVRLPEDLVPGPALLRAGSADETIRIAG